MCPVIGSIATGHIASNSSAEKGSPSSAINLPKYSLVRYFLFSGSRVSKASRSFSDEAGSALLWYAVGFHLSSTSAHLG